MAGWGRRYQAFSADFGEGQHASASKDLIPMSSTPRAYNASWEQVGDGTAVVRARRGPYLDVTDQVGGTTSPVTVVAQAFYQRWDTTSEEYTHYHLAFGENGQIVKHNTAQTLTSYSTVTVQGNPAAIQGVTANNRFYLSFGVPILVGAVQAHGVIFDGTTWTPFLATPTSTPTATATGAGSMTGDYEVAISYYNSSRGHETSRTAEVDVTATAQQVRVTWNAPTDPQVTHVRIHLRKGTISKDFYQAASVAVGTTTYDLNVTDAAYNALITKSPSETDHEPPPAGTKLFVWHRGRLFAVTDGTLYYSKSTDDIEGFDSSASEPVNPDDGQKIVTAVSAFDQLVVLKEGSVWALVGDGPNDWVIRNLSQSTGCLSASSVVLVNGILYWWSRHGPVAWMGTGEPVPIGEAYIRDLLSSTQLNYSALPLIQGVLDENNTRILWAVPELGSQRNNLIIPFKYTLGRFEGLWTAIDVASWCAGEDDSGNPVVWAGDYDGRIYRWWGADADGLPNDGGNYDGTYTPGAGVTSTTTITDATNFSLDTDLGGVGGLYAAIIDADGVSFGRKRIASNTATAITFETALTGLTAGTVYSVFIGGIDFQYDTKWQFDELPFHKKRFEFFYLECLAPAATTVYVDFSYDGSETLHTQGYTVTPGSTGGVWDTGEWDSSVWGTVAPTRKRIRMGHTGRSWRARIRHLADRIPFSLLKVGMRGEVTTDKR